MQTLTERPARVAGAISHQLAAQERARKKALQRVAKLRKKASAEIERLIAFLDASDPYVTTELEDQVDDHPCDWDELEKNLSGGGYSHGYADPDGDGERDDSDDEPDLGSLDQASQEHWAAGGAADLEEDNDSGIGDMDGLIEQAGTQDWQQGAMA